MSNETDQAKSDYLRPGEAAKLAFISTKTLTRLADKGDVRSIRLPSGHRRYSRVDVVSLTTELAPSADLPPGQAGGASSSSDAA